MNLPENGLDAYYIDESHDRKIYVVTAVAVPLLRKVEGQWTMVRRNHFEAAKRWRRAIKENLNVPVSKELHGVKLASGRGNFNRGKYNFPRPKCAGVYRAILRNMHHVPDASIMSVVSTRGASTLYGNQRLEAALYALFQRMRTRCQKTGLGAMTFFDQGHPEYRTLYRQAQVYLPTGSMYGGGTRNLPLDMFFEDANEKNSKHCWFTQTADMAAYAAFLKIKSERGELTEWQQKYNWGGAYDEIPRNKLNVRVLAVNRDGIVRL